MTIVSDQAHRLAYKSALKFIARALEVNGITNQDNQQVVKAVAENAIVPLQACRTLEEMDDITTEARDAIRLRSAHITVKGCADICLGLLTKYIAAATLYNSPDDPNTEISANAHEAIRLESMDMLNANENSISPQKPRTHSARCHFLMRDLCDSFAACKTIGAFNQAVTDARQRVDEDAFRPEEPVGQLRQSEKELLQDLITLYSDNLAEKIKTPPQQIFGQGF